MPRKSKRLQGGKDYAIWWMRLQPSLRKQGFSRILELRNDYEAAVLDESEKAKKKAEKAKIEKEELLPVRNAKASTGRRRRSVGIDVVI